MLSSKCDQVIKWPRGRDQSRKVPPLPPGPQALACQRRVMLPTPFPKEKEKSSSNHIHVLLRTRRTKQIGTGRDSSVFRGDGKLRRSWAPTVGRFNTHCREQPLGAGCRCPRCLRLRSCRKRRPCNVDFGGGGSGRRRAVERKALLN